MSNLVDCATGCVGGRRWRGKFPESSQIKPPSSPSEQAEFGGGSLTARDGPTSLPPTVARNTVLALQVTGIAHSMRHAAHL